MLAQASRMLLNRRHAAMSRPQSAPWPWPTARIPPRDVLRGDGARHGLVADAMASRRRRGTTGGRDIEESDELRDDPASGWAALARVLREAGRTAAHRPRA